MPRFPRPSASGANRGGRLRKCAYGQGLASEEDAVDRSGFGALLGFLPIRRPRGVIGGCGLQRLTHRKGVGVRRGRTDRIGFGA